MHVWLPTHDLREKLEPLDGITFEVVERLEPDDLPPSAQTVEVMVPPQAYTGELALLVAKLPMLRVVHTLSAGVDQYTSLPPTVQLYNATGVHVAGTAEWVIAAILACQRSLPEFVELRRRREWAPRITSGLSGAHVVIIGAGEIATAVGALLRPFGAIVTHVARRARAGVVPVERVHDVIGTADIVVLLVPLTDETRHLVDREFLAAMRDGALLVSAARGSVVDTSALLDELTSGRLRAALDVVDPEPPPTTSAIWSAPGLLLTPHIASGTPGVIERQAALLARRLPAFARREDVPGRREHGY